MRNACAECLFWRLDASTARISSNLLQDKSGHDHGAILTIIFKTLFKLNLLAMPLLQAIIIPIVTAGVAFKPLRDFKPREVVYTPCHGSSQTSRDNDKSVWRIFSGPLMDSSV